MMDYAENITAERVKRVIQGYGEGKNAVEGINASFSFYELGEAIIENGELNENVSIDKIREYIWYTETKTPFKKPQCDNKYFLGSNSDTEYYFIYEPEQTTQLDSSFLENLKKENRKVIYADLCFLDETELLTYNVSFKKIPRDVIIN